MKVTQRARLWFWSTAFLFLFVSAPAMAQRDVHWQINPHGFPTDVSVFVDVEERGLFKRDLRAGAFALSMDIYAGDQGGWLLNSQQVVAGWAGAQVIVMVDKSRSYTGEFNKAKRIMRAIVNYLDPRRDQLAIATAPAGGGFSEAKMETAFTADKNVLNRAIDRINPLPSGDKSGARICNALAEGLRWFPEQTSDRYRVVVLLTGGADKGEGNSNCVQDSYTKGKVPFFPIVFKLDRKYDDPRNSNKIKNKTHELAQKTGGRSIFRKSENDYMQFVGLLWNRIRSQYYLRYTFPCYRPMPAVEHGAMLKVEGRDADGIRFQATSTPPPTPVISAIYPAQASRKDVDDGNVDLTIDGSGFCGPVQAFVGERRINLKSQNPYRVVGSLNSSIESGKVKVENCFRKNGESPMKLQIVKPPKGAEASAMLTYLVLVIIGLVVFSVLLVALRSRKAKVTGAPSLSRPSSAPSVAPSTGGVAKTMALNAITRAWIEMKNGKTVDLFDGANIIGREATCRVPLEVPGISREHARIDLQQGQGLIWVEDLGSTNGTFWGPPGAAENDLTQLTKKHLLNSGDTVWIGGECFTVWFEGGTQTPREG